MLWYLCSCVCSSGTYVLALMLCSLLSLMYAFALEPVHLFEHVCMCMHTGFHWKAGVNHQNLMFLTLDAGVVHDLSSFLFPCHFLPPPRAPLFTCCLLIYLLFLPVCSSDQDHSRGYISSPELRLAYWLASLVALCSSHAGLQPHEYIISAAWPRASRGGS